MAIQNKIFAGGNIPRTTQVSKVRRDREYLLSQNTAKELNVYKNFGIFNSFNDVYNAQYNDKGDQIIEGQKGPGTPGVRSLFNKAGAVLIGVEGEKDAKDLSIKDNILNASELRIANNVPLLDSPTNRKRIKAHSGCSIRELVQASEAGVLGRATYSYSDFMYCKYLGRVSNNYLVTLRRFPYPPLDFINGLGEGKTRIGEGKNNASQQIGCMVTWMGTPGNDMANILKYSYTMPFKEQNSQWNSVDGGDADSAGGLLNGIAAAFDPAYRRQFVSGHGGENLAPFMKKFYGTTGPYSAASEASRVDQNKVYGPIDQVKKTYMRSEDGLDFKHNITLTFDYELRSYNGINGRQAMLDLISNILNVTYSTGGFWGGGYRGGGMHQNSIFANLNIFKVNGGLTDFMDAFAQDYSNVTESARNELDNKYGGDWMSMLKAALNALGGMILGGALNRLGRPAKAFANSLLSEQPVGFWHITIGNPHHPIMSMGNMILKNTTIEHYGPLGLDDFPTGLKVTCELERGKPRDLREIEKLYMQGNDRIYHSMNTKIMDMYNAAYEYKKQQKQQADKEKAMKALANDVVASFTWRRNTNTQDELPTGSAEVTKTSTNTTVTEHKDVNEDYLKSVQSFLQKYFGETDDYSIYIAATEQEYGASKKKPKETPTGSEDKSDDKKGNNAQQKTK